MMDIFHDALSSLIRSATVWVWLRIWVGAFGLDWYQKGWLMGMVDPSPTLHFPWVRVGLLEPMIDFQIQDAWGLGLWGWISSLGQYLDLRVLVRRRFGWLHILQYCFAMRALFMDANFFRPSPSKDFGCASVSQLVIWSFLCPGSCPHQKAFIMESSLLQMVMGALKTERV